MSVEPNSLHYNPDNFLPLKDEGGEFFDFFQKSAHPIITDYSRLNREIIFSKDAQVLLGNVKEKDIIQSICKLETVISDYILMLYKGQLLANSYAMGVYGLHNQQSKSFLQENIEHFSSKNIEIWSLINEQVIFDVLYDKYRADSPRLTLNEYCTQLDLDWDDSLFNTIDSVGLGVTPTLFRLCYHTLLKEYTLIGDIKPDTIKQLYKAIRMNEVLNEDHKKFDRNYEKLEPYLESLKAELQKRKDAAYHAMIAEIKREGTILNHPSLKKDAVMLGINPDLFIDYLSDLNAPGKRNVKKPKYVWDYIFYNGCPDLITSKQYKRNFTRDSNTSYDSFIANFDNYDRFVEMILPNNTNTDYDYYNRSMDYYHLEIYKRLDYIYKLAVKMETAGSPDITKDHYLVKRFHPDVFWPHQDENDQKILCYGERNKYYRPPLFLEEYFVNLNQSDIENSLVLNEYQTIRAKVYELLNYNYRFALDDYSQLSDFIRQHYNMQSYHVTNKEWICMERYKKQRIKNVLMINRTLFGIRKTQTGRRT